MYGTCIATSVRRLTYTATLKKIRLFVVFIDFPRAYDIVPRNKVLSVMKGFEVRGRHGGRYGGCILRQSLGYRCWVDRHRSHTGISYRLFFVCDVC